jgi:ADP-ribose pyrophosphatase YjhB (NUDIX family)
MKIKQVFEYYDKEDHRKTSEYKYCPVCQQILTLENSDNKSRLECTRCGFVHYQNPLPVVSILIEDEGRVLLGKRLENPGKGKWALPSGYIEYGDDFLTTGIQEAKEETGLEVEIKSIINVMSSFYSPKFHFLAIYLKANIIQGELEAGDDLEEVKWFSPGEKLTDMAFEEDQEMLDLFWSGKYKELLVDNRYV